jgi:hypothetical protein
MRIGELARRAGIHVQTVRYYERLRLLRAPERSPSGYRTYRVADLERVEFIRKTQEYGFSSSKSDSWRVRIPPFSSTRPEALHRPHSSIKSSSCSKPSV